MILTVRRIADYKEVYVHADNVELDIGMLNDKEQLDMALHLLAVAEEMLPNDRQTDKNKIINLIDSMEIS